MCSHPVEVSAAEPQQASLFEWSVPARYGAERDASGRIVEAKPESVRRGPWPVSLNVVAAFCRTDATYRWKVGTRTLRTRGGRDCEFEARFRREGRYRVRLDARIDGKRFAQTQPVTVQDRLIVSLGDSVASGEAVPDVPDVFRAAWQSARCHRSARAAPAKAAQRMELQDDHTSVTFVHLACSGATIEQGLIGAYGGVLQEPFTQSLPPQVRVLNQIARRREVDAVLISVGANDAFFGDVVRFCAFRSARNCFDERLPAADGDTVDAAVRAALRALPRGYARLADEIASSRRIPDERVHIVEYFDPTRDARGNSCRALFGYIYAPEPELARSRILGPLNDVIAKAADDNGWTAIKGMATRFRNHGYCSGRQSWVTTLSGSVARLGGQIRGRFLGTLHPNEAGHDAIAEGIAESLAAKFYPGQVLIPRATPAPDDGGLTPLAIVGIAAGGLLAALAVGTLGWSLGRRARP